MLFRTPGQKSPSEKVILEQQLGDVRGGAPGHLGKSRFGHRKEPIPRPGGCAVFGMFEEQQGDQCGHCGKIGTTEGSHIL